MKNYVDKDKLQEFATKLHNKQKTIFASKTDVGSPLVASTVAEMTDQTKVYVYTGSETGYTAGNWYYYDGSAWTSGGVYNSTVYETDETLTESGKPADAKVTGDKINQINNIIFSDSEWTDFEWTAGYYQLTNGQPYPQTEPATYHRTQKIDGNFLPRLNDPTVINDNSGSFIMVWNDGIYAGYLMDNVWKLNTTTLSEQPEFTQWALVLHNNPDYANIKYSSRTSNVMTATEFNGYLTGVGKYTEIKVDIIQAGYKSEDDSWVIGYSTRCANINLLHSDTVYSITCKSGYQVLMITRQSDGTLINIGSWTALLSVPADTYYNLQFRKTNDTDITPDEARDNILFSQYDDVSSLAEYVEKIGVTVKKLNVEQNADENLIIKLENASNVAKGDSSTAVKSRSNLLNLIHFSDIHGNTTNIQRILDFYDIYKNYIHDIIHTGDSVTTYYSQANPFDTIGGDQILNVVGNHECWKQGDTWPSPYNATAAEAYAKIFSSYISNWGVTSAGADLCYYYKDYSAAKVRLIVLDSIHYDSAQETWFASTLAGAKTNNYRVVAVCHYPAQTGLTGIDCTFNSLTSTINAAETPAAGEQFERMPESAFATVDTFISGGGEFVCWIGGHVHDDYIGIVNNHTNQIQVLVSCANTSNSYSDCARTNGTKTQDLFNIFTVDGSTKLIKLIRIGATQDKFLRERNTLCINYNTKAVISNN